MFVSEKSAIVGYSITAYVLQTECSSLFRMREKSMNEPSASGSELWRGRLQRLRTPARRALPFASGVLAALVAILLYKVLVPGPHQLTTSEIHDTVAQT